MKNSFSKYQQVMIGTNIAFTIIVSILIGLWLDQKYNSKPKFLLIFFGLSIINAFLLFWNINKKLSKRK